MVASAALIPTTGYKLSGWHKLDEMSRALLLEEILAADARFYVNGTVNYENSREPLLTERSTGMLVTLSGEIVQNPGEPLVINVTGYPRQAVANAGISPIFFAAAVFLLIIGVLK